MIFIITLLILVTTNSFSQIPMIEIDYVKANINRKKYEAVPEDELLFMKEQAYEPQIMFERPLKGRGYEEPLLNFFISKIRDSNINVYVDYFTSAKGYFYALKNNYKICAGIQRPKYIFTNMLKENNTKAFGEKYQSFSNPFALLPVFGRFGVTKGKLSYISKHKWPGTNIYNIKSILDDESLYTVQEETQYSSIKKYIYVDPEHPFEIKKEYKKRVYEFVASKGEQFTLMLKGHRMHWMDMTVRGDYEMHRLGIKPSEMVMLESSDVHPNEITQDHVIIKAFHCVGKDLNELKKIIQIINSNINAIRTNRPFWAQVLANYAKDFKIKYVEPEDFYYTKELFKRKAELDRGDFDLVSKLSKNK